ncbi:hypothetical protein [Geoglobus acetivorans]|uniref:Uncharacterized protein n=1 Tax=Geoglobus acetivorans TaxID=565033 RepID=A0ABZ3H5D5_GEOAI|nr:hypothetical protein [Geoglobus acetivorans]
MAETLTLIREIREMKKKLDEIEKTLILQLTEKERAEIISDGKYRELVKKAEHLKKHPEDGLSVEEAIRELE